MGTINFISLLLKYEIFKIRIRFWFVVTFDIFLVSLKDTILYTVLVGLLVWKVLLENGGVHRILIFGREIKSSETQR